MEAKTIIQRIIFILLLLITAAQSFGKIIYIEEFSQNINGWHISPPEITLNHSADTGCENKGCAVLNIPNQMTANLALKGNKELIQVQANEYYIIRAWMKSDYKCSALLTVTIKNSTDTSLNSYTSQSELIKSWNKIETAIFTSNEGTQLRIDLTLLGSGCVYADDISVEKCTVKQLRNLDLESSENNWARSWAAVAWPVNKSKVYFSNESPFSGKGCLAFELKGKNARAAAINFPNFLPGSKIETPVSLKDLGSIGISCKSKGPKMALAANYYKGAIRNSIEHFELQAKDEWAQFICNLDPPEDVNFVQLEIIAEGAGKAFIDEITLNPQTGKTVKGKQEPLHSEIPVSNLSNVNIIAESQKNYEPLKSQKNKNLNLAIESNRGIHPRLVFSREDIKQLRSRADDTHKIMYGNLMEAIKRNHKAKLGEKEYCWSAVLNAFGYLITDDDAMLAEAKKRLFEICDQYWMPSDLNYSFSIPALALGYDWLYSELTPNERDELRLKISILTRPWYEVTTAMDKTAAWHFNHVNIRPVAFGFAGIALYGDGCAYGGDETAANWANYSKWFMDNMIATLPTDGSYQEGLHYWSCVSEWLVKYLHVYQKLTGENLYDSSNWFKLAPAFRFYPTTTDWHYQACFSDCIIDEIENYPSAVCRALAGQNGPYSGLSQWIADKCNSLNEVDNSRNDERKVWEYIYYAPRVKPLSPQEMNLQKWFYFDDIGLVVSHSSWEPSNDTLFVFKCGPYGTNSGARLYDAGGGGRWGHNHPDAASWQLFHRGSPLALDIGYNMCKRTANHNTVMPGDFTQYGDGEVWLNSIAPCEQAPRIIDFAADSNLFYIKAKAHGNYDSKAKLKQFDRTVYGIDGKWFVIVDELAADINHSYHWILNTRKEGHIHGRSVEIIDDGGPVARGKYSPEKGDIGKINPDGPSKLLVQFFSPEDVTISGQMTQIEKPIDTFRQVWRMKAITKPIKNAKFIAAIVPLGPEDEKPSVIYSCDKIIFDTVRQRTILKLGTSGTTKVTTETKDASFDNEKILKLMKKAAGYQANIPEDVNFTDWKAGTFYAGVMAAFEATGDKELYNLVKGWGEKAEWKLRANPYLADDLCAAQTFIDFYKIEDEDAILNDTKEKLEKYFGKKIIASEELIHITNKNTVRDFSGRNVWWWCDALFMAPPVFAKMYRITSENRYLEMMDKLYWDSADYLYDKKEKLFFRDDRYFNKKTPTGKKVLWGRGNGWVYAGLIRILDEMPADWPTREKYIKLFQQMTESIIKYQQKDGLWRSSLNEPTWFDMPESSCSSFFCYGLAAGINRGYLEPEYKSAVLKAWEGLISCVDSKGLLGYAQVVASKPTEIRPQDSINYAQGAFLLAASEIYKMNKVH